MSHPARLAAWICLIGLYCGYSPAYSQDAGEISLGETLTGDPQQDEQAVAYFETHIRPLLAKHCYQCHAERADEQAGELLLDRRSGWLAGGERGPSVVPGDIEASLLIQAVRYTDPELQMPPAQPLQAQEIAHLENWVRMGAPGPADGQMMVVDDPSDPVAGRSHWAFQPLAESVLPTVQDPNWPRTAIDHFVLAAMEKAGLKPVADASPKVLARRLSFQLVGLPPTSRQLTDLEAADDLPLAVTQQIDQLLSSPQFGQRWGRHWLDLARYADSNGLDENFLFREAWRYRNWVIDAMNQDVPYDRFITEQLAGDLLPYNSTQQRDQQRIAAGFLVVGPKVLLGVPVAQQRMDVADEHIDTVGRAVLAQTLGCARCHDHKFDPIPTADYYALAGIFTSTRVMETRHMLGQQRLMEQLIGLGEQGGEADAAYEKYWREQPALKQRKTSGEKVLEALEQDNQQEFVQLLEQHPDAIAEVSKDTGLPLQERVASQRQLVTEIQRLLDQPPPIPPRAMVPSDVEQPADEAIRLAGQYDALGELIPRGFLSVLSEQNAYSIEADDSGRLTLAKWLCDAENHSGQLAARVLANRIWQHLIGRGIVRTVDNFGRTGEAPTHPELLDYLARRLIASGWSVKQLVREIANSRTFALSSKFEPTSFENDPENQWLWRAHRRRLEPEAIRDALLVAADGLDHAHYASTVDYLGDQATAVGANKIRRRTDFPCRSVYLPVIRNDLPEIFDAFDFTNPHTTTGARPRTIVPAQSLFMLNDEFVMLAAEATARRVAAASPTDDIHAHIDLMFALICNDLPTAAEREAVATYWQQTVSSLRGNDIEGEVDDGVEHDLEGDTAAAELRAWALACHALFASSRFQFVE